MTEEGLGVFEFDDIRIEPRNFTVLKGGSALLLEPKTFLLLVFLIENRDRLIEKREILDVIWKDTAVTENALTREVGKLRKALGDDPRSPKYIQTVHTRGYRFIAPVHVVDLSPEEPQPVEDQRERAISNVPRRTLAKTVGLALTGALVILAGLSFLNRIASANKSWEVRKSGTNGVSTLAVLPFQSLGSVSTEQYLGLAMADALITKLGSSQRLAVRPTSTVLHYLNPKQDSLILGRMMGVDYVLEGKFQTQGDRIRFTVQLLCVSCAKASRWAASFDEKSGDIFHAEDSISEQVVKALTLELTGDQYERLRKRETSDQDAHIDFAKGMKFMSMDTKEDLDKATEYFEHAVRRDPDYAAAWAELSDCYRRQEWFGGAPPEYIAKAREAAKKAVALDETLTYGHSMLGFIAFQFDWDFATAEREYQRAIKFQPAFVHQWYGRYLLAMNRVADAESEYQRFLERSPFSLLGKTNVAQFRFLTGAHAHAIELLRGSLAMNSNYPPAHEILGLVYEQQGRNDQAMQELKKAVDVSHGYVGLGSLGHLYASQGRSADVQKVFQEFAAQAKHRYVGPFEFALVHAGMGENSKALDYLERAYAERSLSAQSLRFDPRLSKVRSEPRFHDFVKRIGLQF
jgi:DNA-binding winged helix-turn-helix (wHTH) protein/TolB-like protein/tetratricopeptide (TPR) repeat protein